MKNYLLLTLSFAGTLLLPAQVLNSGFENLNADGSIKNWGLVFITQVTIDSNGVASSDSIVFDNQLYFSTTDAYAGARAMEMRNAFNYSSGQQIGGSARLRSTDSSYENFAAAVPISQKPLYFSFYYKFLPAGTDTAYATMTILDTNGMEIGSSTIAISAAAGTYTLAMQPVTYYSPDPAGFVQMEFRTAKPGSPASFGTRFLVDQVNGSTFTALSPRLPASQSLRCFPNPAQDYLEVALPDVPEGSPLQLEICSSDGRVMETLKAFATHTNLRLNVSSLGQGVYTLKISNCEARHVTTFIR